MGSKKDDLRMTDCLGLTGTCMNCGIHVLEYLCNQLLTSDYELEENE